MLIYRLQDDQHKRKRGRRRHKRFDQNDCDWILVQIRRTGGRLEFEEILLLNLSFGGMCLQTESSMRTGDEHYFVVDLRAPLDDLAFVKARVEWVNSDLLQNKVGLSFTETTKGWLGTVDDSEADH